MPPRLAGSRASRRYEVQAASAVRVALRVPALAAGVTDHIWSLEEIAALLD